VSKESVYTSFPTHTQILVLSYDWVLAITTSAGDKGGYYSQYVVAELAASTLSERANWREIESMAIYGNYSCYAGHHEDW
jgi:hypothetical protein